MDPMMLMMGLNAIAALNPGGSNGEIKSDYNDRQLNGIDDIWKMIEGMRGGSNNGDISQNQNYQQGGQWLKLLCKEISKRIQYLI